MLRINIVAALLLLLSPFVAVLAEPITTITYTSTCTITKTVSKVVATSIVTGTPPCTNTTTTTIHSTYVNYANSTMTINVAAPTRNVTSALKPTITPTAAPNSASSHHANLVATWLFGSMVVLAGFVL